MDREFIKKISINYYIKKNLSSDDITILMKEYCCKVHNKDEDSTEILIQIMLSNFPVMHGIFDTVLEYYEKQFNIIKIIDDNKIITIQ